MSKIRIKVTRRENLADQVIAAFEKHAGDAVMNTAEEAAKDAKNRVPVRTGELRDSIDVAKVSETEAVFGAQAEHAPFIEFGTSKIAPRSFITSAAINARDLLLKNLTKK